MVKDSQASDLLAEYVLIRLTTRYSFFCHEKEKQRKIFFYHFFLSIKSFCFLLHQPELELVRFEALNANDLATRTTKNQLE